MDAKRFVVISGCSGGGKSTLLIELGRRSVTPRWRNLAGRVGRKKRDCLPVRVDHEFKAAAANAYKSR